MPFSPMVSMLLRQINARRVLAIQGNYGEGKTAIAFRLAMELVEKFNYSYIISNCNSVINDDMNDIALDENGRLNTIIILDEAGEFIQSAKDTKGWLAFMRKLNVCLLIPTFDNLPKNLTRLQISRSETNQALGIDSVVYEISFDGGETKNDRLKFAWSSPSEVWGVYDTDGYPSDAADIMQWLQAMTSKAASKAGYDKTAKKYAPVTFSFGVTNGNNESSQVSQQISDVETSGGQVNEVAQVQAATFKSLSILHRREKA